MERKDYDLLRVIRNRIEWKPDEIVHDIRDMIQKGCTLHMYGRTVPPEKIELIVYKRKYEFLRSTIKEYITAQNKLKNEI